MTIKAVVFDFGGVLIDHGSGVPFTGSDSRRR